MNLRKIKKELKLGKTIFDFKLKVTYYDRPIYIDEESQKCYLENFIRCEKNWTYIQGYNDELENANKFLKLIEDAKQNKFDMLLVSRSSKIPVNILKCEHLSQIYIGRGVSILYKLKYQVIMDFPKDEDIEWKLVIIEANKF